MQRILPTLLSILLIFHVNATNYLSQSYLPIGYVDEAGYVDETGHDCGRVYFSNLVAVRAVNNAMKYLNQGFRFPIPYKGHIFKSELGYQVWPILENMADYNPRGRKEGIFRIVFTPAGFIIAVLAQLIDGSETICFRRYSSNNQQIESVDGHHSFKCGMNLITNELIEMNAALARSNKHSGMRYPIQFKGKLYGKERGYLLSPIFTSYSLDSSTLVLDSLQYLVLSPNYEVVDVVAALSGGDYTKCIRKEQTTKRFPIITSPPSNPSVKIGYRCEDNFYEEKFLQNLIDYVAQNPKPGFQNFNIKEATLSEDESFKILIPNVEEKNKKSVHKHFAIVSSQLIVKGAYIETPQGYKRCEESMQRQEIEEKEKEDFLCQNKIIPIKKIRETARIACKNYGRKGRGYPALYLGPGFEVIPPYVTWPLQDDEDLKFDGNDPVKNFVVINFQCQVAGVITTIIDGTLRKCVRASGRPIKSITTVLSAKIYQIFY